MHFAQARTRLPPNRAHCKFGYLRTFWVGLYLPLSFTRVQFKLVFLAQTAQIFEAIGIYNRYSI